MPSPATWLGHTLDTRKTRSRWPEIARPMNSSEPYISAVSTSVIPSERPVRSASCSSACGRLPFPRLAEPWPRAGTTAPSRNLTVRFSAADAVPEAAPKAANEPTAAQSPLNSRRFKRSMVSMLCSATFPTIRNVKAAAVQSRTREQWNRLDGANGIQCEELLRLRHPAQGIAAHRYEMAAHPVDTGECFGHQHRLIDRAAHCRNSARFVDRGSDHGEIEPLGASDIAVEDFADMQTNIHIGGRQRLSCTPRAQRLHLLACFNRGRKRGCTGMRTIFGCEDRQDAIANQLEHVPALRVDRRNDDVGIIVQQRNDLLR